MTIKEIKSILDKVSIPLAYDHFAEGESPDPPFLVYLFPSADNFAADGVAYFKQNVLHVEVYTDRKDISLEERVEAVFDEHGLFYSKSETWIPAERMYEVLYQMEV